jgi:hypothetical protein
MNSVATGEGKPGLEGPACYATNGLPREHPATRLRHAVDLPRGAQNAPKPGERTLIDRD